MLLTKKMLAGFYYYVKSWVKYLVPACEISPDIDIKTVRG